MDEVADIIVKLHAAPPKAVLVAAGAGSSALAWLLSVPGASRTLLEARVPYGRGAMLDLLGSEPEQYVSPHTARDLARAAYRRGLLLREDDSPIVGIACTAAIATDRARRGADRAGIAAWDADRLIAASLTLEKGQRDRAGEEEVFSRLLIQTMAQAFGLTADLPLGLTAAEIPEITAAAHPGPIARLLAGEVDAVICQGDGQLKPVERAAIAGAAGLAVLPGSFSPLHYGHRELARVAGEMTGLEVVYEMSVVNVDKPPLAAAEIRRRAAQFAGQGRVALTRARTFREKADLFPGSVFVIGWDTLIRLIDPKYYGGSEGAMLTALAEIWALGCRFLVAGRALDGAFRTLAEAAIPAGFSPLFQALPESAFRADISSTELRAQGGG